MKTTLTIICALLLVGCASTREECLSNAQIYNDYIAALQAGEVLSEEEIAQARLAATLLNVTCGWQVQSTRSGPTDHNGVLIIRPPSKGSVRLGDGRLERGGGRLGEGRMERDGPPKG